MSVIQGIFSIECRRRYIISRRGTVTGSIREQRREIVSIEGC
jgi:hypothetical protein